MEFNINKNFDLFNKLIRIQHFTKLLYLSSTNEVLHMKQHNFSSGPSILSATVFEQAAQAVLNYEDSGLSILEISHRSEAFAEILQSAQQMVLELMQLQPKEYDVLFLQGGASMEFLRIPYNFLNSSATAVYLDTGLWAHKAIEQAQQWGNVHIAASSREQHYSFIPKEWSIPKEASYVHCTSNNTIYGTQMTSFPVMEVPLICDMSSDLFSRELDYSKFALIYAGAQKNLGPAGVSVVVLKKNTLPMAQRYIPNLLNYNVHVTHNSMYNTPAVFAIYTCYLSLKELIAQGGIASVEQKNIKKAQLLYQEIDRNSLFEGTAVLEDRSLMNACFVLKDKTLKEHFDAFWPTYHINGLKGHRTVGGYRASIYNAMPLESVEVLVQCLQDFESIQKK